MGPGAAPDPGLDLGADFGDLPDLGDDPLPDLGAPGRDPVPVGPGAGLPTGGEGRVLALAQLAAMAANEAGVIRRAQVEVDAADLGVKAADAARWPKLSLVGSLQESNHRTRIAEILGPELAPSLARPLSDIRNDSAFQAGFDVEVPFYRAGLFNAVEDVAREDAAIARLRHLQSVESVLLATVELYLDLLLADAGIAVEGAREKAAAAQQEEAVAGASTDFVRSSLALEYELQASRARGKALELAQARALTYQRLAALLGKEGETAFEPARRFDLKPGPATPAAAGEAAMKGNLEVRIRMAEAAKASRRVAAAASGSHPSVDMAYRWRHASPNYSDRVDADWWEAVVKVDYAAFDGGKTRFSTRKAREEAKAADLLVAETARRAAYEARAAHEAEGRSRAEARRAAATVELARRHVRAVQDRTDGAKLTASDAAKARVALLAAQLEEFRLLAEAVRARARIHALTGQLTLDKFE